jgi:hypothetical protein
LVSARREPLDRIAALDWHAAFVHEREAFVNDVHVYCFGHAILEALREPYVGLMGKAILCQAPAGMLDSEPAAGADCSGHETELARLDRWLAAQLSMPQLPRLHALPVLGVPGWHAANERRSFYAEPRYFRRLSIEHAARPG